MTRDDIVTLFEYDAWATDRILELLSGIAEAQFREDLKSSHGGIQGTLVHIYSANMILLQRWEGGSPSSHVGVEEIPDLESLTIRWKAYRTRLDNYLQSLTAAQLRAPLSHTDLKGVTHSEPLYQQMQHIVNHSSYHRGQIITMLRQLGLKPVGTDMIAFFRTKPPAVSDE